ncbi:single-stranded DNA-binding protein [candidate division KSB1 bacterium]|nr:single-stranded DNA-binding protein [candidate division KSB1 bacterium]
MSFNKITIVGYLGRDPELRYTPQGTALCKMSIATSDKRKNVAGEMEEHTTWFRVTAWGRQAELANEYLAKGRQVYIEGRLRLEEYTDREGQKRFSAEVSASEIQFLGHRAEAPNAGAAQEAASADQSQGAISNGASNNSNNPKKTSKSRRGSQEELVSIEEDDIPF